MPRRLFCSKGSESCPQGKEGKLVLRRKRILLLESIFILFGQANFIPFFIYLTCFLRDPVDLG